MLSGGVHDLFMYKWDGSGFVVNPVVSMSHLTQVSELILIIDLAMLDM